MTQFTVEEMNLLSIYHEGSREQLRENMNAALPYMDADMRELAKRTRFQSGRTDGNGICGACRLRR